MQQTNFNGYLDQAKNTILFFFLERSKRNYFEFFYKEL